MTTFSPKAFRQHFPLLHCAKQGLQAGDDFVNQAGNNPYLYFDNAATTQKPESVITSYQTFYQQYNANVHRASHTLSAKATTEYERARVQVKELINASSTKEIIWTKGATESINLIASAYGSHKLSFGDEIIIAVSEHHANIVPWQVVAQQTGAVIKVLPLNQKGCVDLTEFEKLVTKNTKIVCCSHVSNVIGKINPIEAIIAKAKSVGAITVIDGAQAIAHFNIDVQKLACDFYVFSAHKMYGPTGVGVLYGKQALLDVMTPYQAGGEMIKTVSFTQATTFNTLPFKFEAGTPNIAGVIVFSQAISFMEQFHGAAVRQYEQSLTQYCYDCLARIPQVTFIVSEVPDIPVLSFTISSQHNHDIASALDSVGIAVRSGHHCAMPLMEYLAINGCLRVSLAAYNTVEEIDYFINQLKMIINNVSDLNKQKNIDETTKTTLTSENIIQLFANISGWHNRHREIMLLSKQLERMKVDARNEDTLIAGCESLAWIVAKQDEHGRFHFHADSDAKIIRGLLVIVLAAFNDKTASAIQAVDIDQYFEKLGLLQQLSPSRGNGLLAIVEKIKTIAQK